MRSVPSRIVPPSQICGAVAPPRPATRPGTTRALRIQLPQTTVSATRFIVRPLGGPELGGSRFARLRRKLVRLCAHAHHVRDRIVPSHVEFGPPGYARQLVERRNGYTGAWQVLGPRQPVFLIRITTAAISGDIRWATAGDNRRQDDESKKEKALACRNVHGVLLPDGGANVIPAGSGFPAAIFSECRDTAYRK